MHGLGQVLLETPRQVLLEMPCQVLLETPHQVLLDGGRPTRFDPMALAQEVRAMAVSLRRRNADLFAVATAIAERLP